ncbi:MAG: cytochrome c [Nitrospirota bacterium]
MMGDCRWRIVVFIGTMALAGCQGQSSPAPSAGGAAPAEFAKGEALFNANCAKCHGERAAGTNQGPSLVQKIYEPSHHSDASFHLAARNGVRPHHWQFGPMPPIAGVSEAEVNEIIGYVRWLQREAGIF